LPNDQANGAPDEVDSDLNPPPPGTGGKEVFVFKGLARGSADVEFTYKRPWEDEVLKTEVININVLANPGEEIMSSSEAMEIAQMSECVVDGWFTGDAFYNDDTGTWWFDLDIEKEGCHPACVVNVATGEAEINWRCTGALPPTDEDRILVPVPLVRSVPDASLPDGIPTPQLPDGQSVIAPEPGVIDGPEQPMPVTVSNQDGPIVEAPSITVVTIEQSLEIAEQAVYNYVKGQDDLESLTLVETLTARCPSCWAFKFEAQTDKGLMNATVIVEQGEVERLDFGPKPYAP